METFENYRIASITEEEQQMISSLEKDMGNDSDKQIVLVAYEKKNTSQS